MPEDVHQIKTEIAVLGNKLENISQDLKNVATVIALLVTRREWDERKAWSDQQLSNHHERLAKIERTQTWLMQGFAVGGAAVIGGAWAFLRGKVGLP